MFSHYHHNRKKNQKYYIAYRLSSTLYLASSGTILQIHEIFHSGGIMKQNTFYSKKWIVILSIIILLSGCLQQKSLPETTSSPEKDIQRRFSTLNT